MSEIGIDAALNLLSREELERKFRPVNRTMYVFGFRSELGDAYDFYSSAVRPEPHTTAESIRMRF